MCMFSGVHPLVTATRILVALVAMNFQLTVYQNNISFTSGDGEGTAMILPVPGNGNIKAVDFSSYSTVFDDLNLDNNQYDGIGTLGSSFHKKNTLTVRRVGFYDVSIAKNLDDLESLDWTFFKLDKDIVSVLRTHYKERFGFVIARICRDASINNPHPLAYIHEMDCNNTLFVPTRHEGHDLTNVKSKSGSSVKWDHTIFIYGSDIDRNYRRSPTHRYYGSHFDITKVQRILNQVNESFTLVSESRALLNRMDFKGYYENDDLRISIEDVSVIDFAHPIVVYSYDFCCSNYIILICITVCSLFLSSISFLTAE